MCNQACIDFGKLCIFNNEIEGKSVIEVGSLDVNGSLRSVITPFKPITYIGVDICTGPGVDEICDAENLIKKFGIERFDVVVSTELLEHVVNWRKVVSNLKRLLVCGGYLFITTRSKGTKYHGWPYDFWRYEIDDIRQIFSDFDIEILKPDPSAPGVFLKARKRELFVENDLREIMLFSILTNTRVSMPPSWILFLLNIYNAFSPLFRLIFPPSWRAIIKRAILRQGS